MAGARFQADVAVQTRLPIAKAASMLRGALRRIDPTVPAIEIHTVRDMISERNQRRRFEASILSAFAAFSVFLALGGVYGLTMYTVRLRTAEIGIRIALGSSRAQVVRMVIGQNMALVVAGLVLGLGAAATLTRILAASLYGVTALDPGTFLFVTLFMLVVAFAACLIPARNAAGIDPAAALRWE